MRFLPLLSVLLASCVIHDEDHFYDYDVEPDADGNHAPRIGSADAGCYWDSWNTDWVWWFEASVVDGDGALDVFAVQVDVRDAWADEVVDVFELYPTDNRDVWFSDWLGASTRLDCRYGGYNADFWVYDHADASGSGTVALQTD